MHANLTASNSTVLLQDRQDISQYNFPALIFGVLLIVVIICGNLLVCLSVHSEKALKTTTNYFIVSLAVADLMLAVVVLPLFVYAEVTIVDPYLDITSIHWALMGPEGCLFQGGVWSLNMTICDCLMTMDVMLCTASIFNLCAISIDRFIAVVIPLNYNRKHVDQRQMFLLAGTWVLALAVASPVMFGINNVPRRDPSLCKLEDDDYVVYSSVCSFFIPCPIMLLLYCGMFRGLRRWEEARKAKLRSSLKACRKLQGAAASRPPLATLPPLASLPPPLPPIIERDVPDQDTEPCPEHTCSFAPPGFKGSPVATVAFPYRFTSEPPKRKRAKINGRERKAMKVLPVVVGAFLLCWTPFFVVHTLRARCPSCPVPPSVMSTVTWLGYVNSALNPIIYTVFNTEFRNFFKRFLHSCCSRS